MLSPLYGEMLLPAGLAQAEPHPPWVSAGTDLCGRAEKAIGAGGRATFQ